MKRIQNQEIVINSMHGGVFMKRYISIKGNRRKKTKHANMLRTNKLKRANKLMKGE